MKNSNVVFLDLETTGVAPKFDKIVEVGLIRVEKGKVVKKYSQLVKPPFKIPFAAQSVHGISDAMVRDMPPIKEIKSELAELLRDAYIITHSTNHFDMHFLRNSLGENFVDMAKHINLLFLSRKLDKEFTSHKLESVATRYSVRLKDQHRALSDANTTYECFVGLCKRHNIDDINKIVALLRVKARRKE